MHLQKGIAAYLTLVKVRRTWIVWLLVGFLLTLAAGCGRPEEQETPSPTPAPTMVATATRTPTPRPTATFPPTATPFPTSTPELPPFLPAGWRQFGNERFGLLVAAPQSWVNWTWALREAGAIERFGPHLLLVADSQATAEQLLGGASSVSGAYAFGFLSQPGEAAATPDQKLTELLAALEPESEILSEPARITFGTVSGVYADVARNPLELFPGLVQPQYIRLVTLQDSGSEILITFLMATNNENWTTYQETFTTMVDTITPVELRANISDHITSGMLVNSSLTDTTNDLWTFNGNSGQYATITLTPEEENMDLTLTLVSPSGNVLVSIDNGYAGDLETLTDILLPENGTYIIEAGEFFNEIGRYTISLLISDEPQFGGGGRIEFGQEISSELPENGEHNWIFNGTAGQSVTIILTPLNDQLDAILELHSPNDRELVVLDEGFVGDPEIITGFELAVTGDYIIVVYGFAGHSGGYTLSLDLGGESTANFYDAGDLSYGDTRRELLRADEAHAWFFEGNTGDDITIQVRPLNNNLDMDIWLLDPEAQQLVTKDEFLSGQAETIEFILPATGQFIILVREFFGEPGEYEISLNIVGESESEAAGTLSYGQTITGTVPAGKRVVWTFSGQSGDIINITLRPTSPSRDLVFSLVDPEGNIVLTVDSALSGLPERLIAFTLPEDGDWTIIIQEFFNEGSSYEMTLTKQES